MNVLISNKANEMFQQLNIDIIKSLNGVFSVDEIIATFKNFYFQRMILDITALENYKDIGVLQRLSVNFDMNKIILVLDDSDESSTPAYLSSLVSMGIYNFTKNLDGIRYLIDHPNSYKDVAQYQQIQQPSMPGFVTSPINSPKAELTGAPVTASVLQSPVYAEAPQKRVIGVKNITKQAGATTLVYMLRNQLKGKYRTMAIEVDKSDFKYFMDDNLVSCTSNEIASLIRSHDDIEVFIIDVNGSKQAEQVCTDIVYLIEPSTIKLNKLIRSDSKILDHIRNKKIVLNKSYLTNKDVSEFEVESGVRVFYNLACLDERNQNNYQINDLLNKLGFGVANG